MQSKQKNRSQELSSSIAACTSIFPEQEPRRRPSPDRQPPHQTNNNTRRTHFQIPATTAATTPENRLQYLSPSRSRRESTATPLQHSRNRLKRRNDAQQQPWRLYSPPNHFLKKSSKRCLQDPLLFSSDGCRNRDFLLRSLMATSSSHRNKMRLTHLLQARG